MLFTERDWYWAAEFRYAGKTNESTAPIRGFGLAAGVMPVPGNGLCGPRRSDDHRRARLLPYDVKPVQPDGDACIAWLLPEGSAECLRKRVGYQGSSVPPGCGSCLLVGRFPTGESDLFNHRMD